MRNAAFQFGSNVKAVDAYLHKRDTQPASAARINPHKLHKKPNNKPRQTHFVLSFSNTQSTISILDS